MGTARLSRSLDAEARKTFQLVAPQDRYRGAPRGMVQGDRARCGGVARRDPRTAARKVNPRRPGVMSASTVEARPAPDLRSPSSLPVGQGWGPRRASRQRLCAGCEGK